MFTQLLHSQQQMSLAKLVGVSTITQMPYRTYCQPDLYSGIKSIQPVKSL